jgi:pilus assembly protein TadC
MPGDSMIVAALAAAAAFAAVVRPASRPPRPELTQKPTAVRRRRPDLLGTGVVRGVCLGAGLCLALAGAGVAGAVLGVVAAVLLPRMIGRAEPSEVGTLRRAVAADLPWVLELLAAAVRAGTPAAEALDVVGDAVRGELGQRLTRVHGHLAVGVPPEEAWAGVSRLGGEALGPVGEAFVAAAVDGSHLAARLEEQARDARADAAAAALAAAQRVGVRAVLPLGLCFLPAFVAVGVVPVVAAALGQLR